MMEDLTSNNVISKGPKGLVMWCQRKRDVVLKYDLRIMDLKNPKGDNF